MTRGKVLAASAAALLIAGCTGSGSSVITSSTPPVVHPTPQGPTGPSAAQAAKELCDVPHQGPAGGPPHEGPTPPVIAQIEGEVKQVTGLRWEKPVFPDPVTPAQMSKDVDAAFRKNFPQRQEQRRTSVWQTMGILPADTSLRAQLRTFLTGQVIGFYEPITGQLVFIGSKQPTEIDKITLAHELIHAIDDQHFGLIRLNGLQESCNDEAFQAALGAVEGAAQYYSMEVALKTLTLSELPALLQGVTVGSLVTPSGMAPFVERTQLWAYIAGLAFMRYESNRGGNAAIDRTLRHLPASTEQIMHPELYPNDVPVAVNVPDYGSVLGKGWHDMDVMTTGEEWLNVMLGLRLSQAQAEQGAAGWGGALYRAWSGPSGRVAVDLRTVWDTPSDAVQFGDAMRSWLAAGGVTASVLPAAGAGVDVLYGSDAATLRALTAAVAG